MRKSVFSLMVSLLVLCTGMPCCIGGQDDPDVISCDPYEDNPEPTELSAVFAVGQDEAGVLYVVDLLVMEELFRVFVSQGDSLFRKEIADLAHEYIGGVGNLYTFVVWDDPNEYTLVLEIGEDHVAQLARVPGEYEGTIAGMGDHGELLAPLDLSAVAGMAVVNLPDVVVTEHLVQVGNGNSMVVTRARIDEDLRAPALFYGPDDRMEERWVLKVEAVGAGRAITFALDSSLARICFGCEEPASLQTNGQQIPVTVLDPASQDMGRFSFFCILHSL